MKFLINLLLIIVLVGFMSSCNKEEDDNPTTPANLEVDLLSTTCLEDGYVKIRYKVKYSGNNVVEHGVIVGSDSPAQLPNNFINYTNPDTRVFAIRDTLIPDQEYEFEQSVGTYWFMSDIKLWPFISELTSFNQNAGTVARGKTSYASDSTNCEWRMAPNTLSATNIDSTTAQSGGREFYPSMDVVKKGIEYQKEVNPNNEVFMTNDGKGQGDFVSNLTDMDPGMWYTARAYAEYADGKVYFGKPIGFRTIGTGIVIFTDAGSNISSSGFTSGGWITDDGGEEIIERGVVYGTSKKPTTAGDKVISGSGTGIYTSEITGLSSGTLYYVRAYAISTLGTEYGNQQSVTTN